MRYNSQKPIWLVVIVILFLSTLAHQALTSDHAESELQAFATVRHEGPHDTRRTSGFDRVGEARLLVKSHQPTPVPTLTFRLEGVGVGERPHSARIRISTLEGIEPKFARIEESFDGLVTFRNVPLNQRFEVQVAAWMSFPVTLEVDGPKRPNETVPYALPFASKTIRAKMRGEDNRLLDHEWVVVDLYSGRPGYRRRLRLPAQSIDEHGFINMKLYHPPEGQFAMRFMQDEGKELAKMTRVWAGIPDDGHISVDLGQLKLTKPPFFASGKTISSDGSRLRYVQLDVLKQEAGWDDWFKDSSISTSSDWRGNWRIHAELDYDLLQIIPHRWTKEAREDFFVPRGTQDLVIQLYDKE